MLKFKFFIEYTFVTVSDDSQILHTHTCQRKPANSTYQPLLIALACMDAGLLMFIIDISNIPLLCFVSFRKLFSSD